MKVQKFDVDLEAEIAVEVTIEAVCLPSIPPPPCSNPSSPDFSDCGDPGGIEEYFVYLTRMNHRTGKEIRLDITDFVDDDEISGLIDEEAKNY
jgi:hypothetical protein